MNMILIIIGVIIVITIVIFNSIINLKNKVKRDKSLIDVYLQKRFDLIPNLVEITKKYSKYEEETFTNIAKLRSEYNSSKKLTLGNKINKQIETIMIKIENYPNIKADEQYAILQKSLIKIEDELQAARRIYNMDVTNYNIKISKFPNNILAKILKFNEEKLFEFDEK